MSRKLRLTLYILAAAVIAVCGYFAVTALKAPTESAWIKELQYKDSEIQPLLFIQDGDRSCPQIPVLVGDTAYDMMFDTGCGVGIFFTDAMADQLKYTVLGEVEEVNRDGSHRGWSKRVSVDSFSIGGTEYKNVETTLSDWSLYSSSPFNGSVGLKYFADKVVTLDYANGQFAVSSRPVDYAKLPESDIVLPLYHSTGKGQETLLFFEAELDGEPITVYLDTGTNYSYIYDEDSADSSPDNPGEACDVSLTIGGKSLTLRDMVKTNNMAQAQGLPYPTRIAMNSDQIWKNRMVVTIDLISQKIILQVRE